MFVNYAHRGASAYAPENTMSAFRLAVRLGANGVETDVRYTKDGVPVLFHDASLLRLTGIDQALRDLTFGELPGLRGRSPDGSASDAVPTLTEFLDFAARERFVIALELKDDGLEEDVLRALDAHGAAGRCIVTSFCPERLGRVRPLDSSIGIGLLTDTADDDAVAALRRVGGQQICPKADVLSPELVRELHGEGFDVRAWGVRDEAMMRFAVRCGVDGMTVNFPDKLRAYLRSLGIDAP